jgi:hypothetical protein
MAAPRRHFEAKLALLAILVGMLGSFYHLGQLDDKSDLQTGQSKFEGARATKFSCAAYQIDFYGRSIRERADEGQMSGDEAKRLRAGLPLRPVASWCVHGASGNSSTSGLPVVQRKSPQLLSSKGSATIVRYGRPEIYCGSLTNPGLRGESSNTS